MQKSKSSTISLTKYAAYSCVLNFTIFLTQIYLVTNDYISFIPKYIGPVFMPLVICLIMFLLIIGIFIFTTIQGRKRECRDELADLNRYKAGSITKFIFGSIMIFTVVIVKDFSVILTDNFVTNIMSIFVILLTLWEFIENIVFIILEKYCTE